MVVVINLTLHIYNAPLLIQSDQDSQPSFYDAVYAAERKYRDECAGQSMLELPVRPSGTRAGRFAQSKRFLNSRSNLSRPNPGRDIGRSPAPPLSAAGRLGIHATGRRIAGTVVTSGDTPKSSFPVKAANNSHGN